MRIYNKELLQIQYPWKIRIPSNISKVIENIVLICVEIFIILNYIFYAEMFFKEMNYSSIYLYVYRFFEMFCFSCFVILLPFSFLRDIRKRIYQINNNLYVIYEHKRYYFDGISLILRPKVPIKSILQIENLEKFTDTLEKLDLSKNLIRKIEFDGNFQYLKDLNLSNNLIAQIENLDNMTNLTHLRIKNNCLIKLGNLQKNKELRYIHASQNNIEKLEDMRNPHLFFLDLSRNRLTSLDGIQGLYNLSTLILSHNLLTKVSHLEYLIELRVFIYRKNPLDADPLKPKRPIAKSWVKYCQLNGGPQVIEKLKELESQFPDSKRLHSFLEYLYTFYH